MEILFLDQTGKIGGAERSLAAIAERYHNDCLVALFEDGPYYELLKERNVPVKVFAGQALQVRRESGLIQGLMNIGKILPLVNKAAQMSRDYDVIHANTPKALVVGAFASLISRRPLVYHLRDILVSEHFSQTNQRVLVSLANIFVSKVIAVSQAARNAFVNAGGKSELVEVIYNGFEVDQYQGHEQAGKALRQTLGIDDRFVVGHFSRLAEWKGQHILIKAIAECSDNVLALLVGDALFGEEDYVRYVHTLVDELKLGDKVKFLGFRQDIPQLIAACDAVVHSSIAPEPSSRVLIEAMLGAKPLIATRDGGTVELVEDGQTGWLVTPDDPSSLAKKISEIQSQPEYRAQIGNRAQAIARQRFSIDTTWKQVDNLLRQVAQAS